MSRKQSELVYYCLHTLTFSELFHLDCIQSYSLNIGMQSLLLGRHRSDMASFMFTKTVLTENVFICWLCLTSSHPRGKAPIFYPDSFFFNFFLPPHLRRTKRFPLGIFVSWEILFTITQLCSPPLLMLRSSLAPSLSSFLWVTRDKNLQWCWRKRSAWRARLQQRDTDIWRGFVTDSKGGREGGDGALCLC